MELALLTFLYIRKQHCKFHDFLCNIINNSQYDDKGYILADRGELDVEKCYVLNNRGSIFCKWYLTIINCKIDNIFISEQGFANVIIANNTDANELNSLHHISTRKCYANIHIEKTKFPPYFQMHTLRFCN